MKHRLLGISILFLVVSSLVMPVHAQAGIDVTNDQATLSFPNSITFSADIQADTQIASVILEYGVEQLTCGEVVGKAFPDFTPGKDVSVQWTWDMRQSGSEPPGAAIWWQWRVTLQDDGLEAVVVVEVHVRAAEHVHVLVVLDVDELLRELALVVVVDDREHAGHLLARLPRVLHQALADHVAHQLGARRVAAARHAPVQLLEQTRGQRHAEADGVLARGHAQSQSWMW